MTKTLVLSTIITAVILLSGTLGYALNTPDVFASGQGNGNDGDNGKEGHGEKGCETATEASDGKTKNPHCEDCEQTCENAYDVCIASGTNPKECVSDRALCMRMCVDQEPPKVNRVSCQCAIGPVPVATCESTSCADLRDECNAICDTRTGGGVASFSCQHNSNQCEVLPPK